jgi:hypothetical protein
MKTGTEKKNLGHNGLKYFLIKYSYFYASFIGNSFASLNAFHLISQEKWKHQNLESRTMANFFYETLQKKDIDERCKFKWLQVILNEFKWL